MDDSPQKDPKPHFLSDEDLKHVEKGSFYLIRPEWIFGPFQTMQITGGFNKGKFFVCPRNNFSCVSIYFQGEGSIDGRRRFGDCDVSCHRDWLKVPENVLSQTPVEVVEWYKKIAKRLASGVIIKAGVHRYNVTPSVLDDPTILDCLPPFDFIPWDEKVLHERQK